MVMPRSRSMSIESSTCSFISRWVSPPVIWIRRSASVDFPWSIWATMEKLRICARSVIGGCIAAGGGEVQGRRLQLLGRLAGGELEAAGRPQPDQTDQGDERAHAPHIPSRTDPNLETEIGLEHTQHRHAIKNPEGDSLENE